MIILKAAAQGGSAAAVLVVGAIFGSIRRVSGRASGDREHLYAGLRIVAVPFGDMQWARRRRLR